MTGQGKKNLVERFHILINLLQNLPNLNRLANTQKVNLTRTNFEIEITLKSNSRNANFKVIDCSFKCIMSPVNTFTCLICE
ncbi:hypothetical protein Fmac_020178 [Flemingia macrophylla]|uniref:Transposase n=1 Tax=Flemingia macrophylla TaxID=520843 RepID=A0ABD1LTF7_9FABA